MNTGQEATVRTGHGIQSGSKLGKAYIKAVYCHPAYLNYMQSISCKMPGWMKHKLESRFMGETSITLEMQMTAPYGCQRGTNCILMKVKEKSENLS